MPFAEWHDPDGGTHHLVDDGDIRSYFGRLIGLIASSHTWPLERVETTLKTEVLTAPPWLPGGWTVDALKLAVLLRVADALQLDARRAPAFLRALRSPSKDSDDHWKFQSYLGRPALYGDHVLFTSGRSFQRHESDAWWLCYETIKSADKEIRESNEVLRENTSMDTARPPLACEGIVGVEDPLHLAKYIRVDGWTPIDIRLHVTDIPRLVDRFGGKALYGDDPLVPLRELIQNACDAIRARRLLENRTKEWGDIRVSAGHDESGNWIQVTDEGVGMSERVLTGALLDFSGEFWNTDLAVSELPGLSSRRFSSSGRFGVGFFSVFMWGDRVQVATRRYDRGPESARILEFGKGLAGRPILRRALESDGHQFSGTRVRVWPRASVELPVELAGIRAACWVRCPREFCNHRCGG